MATRDILTLKTPMAEGIIRLLYTIALILIAIGVLMGLARGVMIMTPNGSDVESVVRDAVQLVQMPSLLFKRSLTACGLALPPDDFIT